MKSPAKQRAKELVEEADHCLKALREEGKSDAECRYMEVVSELLCSVLFRLDSCATIFLILLGVLLGHFLGVALFGQ